MFGQQAANQVRKNLTWIEVDPIPRVDRARKESNSRRIVQTAPGEKTDQAAPDAFLGQHTQSVDRQTVNRQHTTAMGEEKRTSPPKTLMAAPSARASAKDKSVNSPALSQFGIPIIPDAKEAGRPKVDERTAPEFADQGNMPQDYVKGLKESERTALNTREYVFYGYFQRIRQRLDRAWGTILHEQLMKFYRGGRHLASDMDHTTRILVTLNSIGEIVRVQVVEESGTRDLDDAAVKAFNQAGPFPNPPKGIVSKDGNIQIRWDFILKT